MNLKFLGTSAANAYPEAFCKCENCCKAREYGGKNLRKRSAALINDDLLIDLGPDIMVASQIHGISLVNVEFCLQTHPHADHLDLSHLNSRSPGYGVIGAPCLNLYASSATWERADETFRRDLSGFGLLDEEAEEELNMKIHQVQPFEPYKVGSYRVIAMPANHAPGFGAFLYAIESNHRSIFYGTDTAELFDDTWRAFCEYKLKFDIIVFDHTYGPNESGSDHLSVHQVVEHTKRMKVEGILKENGRVFATHISHEGNPVHAELERFAERNGYEVAYDGLVVTA